MRPLGCSMIEETAGSRRDEAGAAPRSPGADGWSGGVGAVASRTRTPADAKSAARKADTGPSPRAVNSVGASPEGESVGEPTSASSAEGARVAATSAA